MWGWTFGDQSTVTVHVRRLREKIETTRPTPRGSAPSGASATATSRRTPARDPGRRADRAVALAWRGAGRRCPAALLLRLLRAARSPCTSALLLAVTVLAVLAGVLGVAEAMFISAHDLRRAAHRGRRRPAWSASLVGAVARAGGWPRAGDVGGARPRERERQMEASRRELVAWVSHDLRTPLAGMRAMAEALEDGVVDDPETVAELPPPDPGRDRPDGRAGRRPVRAVPDQRRRAAAVARRGVAGRRGLRRGRRRRRRSRPAARVRLVAAEPRLADRAGQRARSWPGWSPTCCATRSGTRRPTAR